MNDARKAERGRMVLASMSEAEWCSQGWARLNNARRDERGWMMLARSVNRDESVISEDWCSLAPSFVTRAKYARLDARSFRHSLRERNKRGLMLARSVNVDESEISEDWCSLAPSMVTRAKLATRLKWCSQVWARLNDARKYERGWMMLASMSDDLVVVIRLIVEHEALKGVRSRRHLPKHFQRYCPWWVLTWWVYGFRDCWLDSKPLANYQL